MAVEVSIAQLLFNFAGFELQAAVLNRLVLGGFGGVSYQTFSK